MGFMNYFLCIFECLPPGAGWPFERAVPQVSLLCSADSSRLPVDIVTWITALWKGHPTPGEADKKYKIMKNKFIHKTSTLKDMDVLVSRASCVSNWGFFYLKDFSWTKSSQKCPQIISTHIPSKSQKHLQNHPNYSKNIPKTSQRHSKNKPKTQNSSGLWLMACQKIARILCSLVPSDLRFL